MIKLEERNEKDIRKELEKTVLFSAGEGETVTTIVDDKTIVGFVKYHINKKELAIAIETIEILEEFQDRRYAKEALRIIFEKNPYIPIMKGLSHPDAVYFWDSTGANFYSSCEDCDYLRCSEHPDFNEDNEDDDNISLGPCDDYSENYFILNGFKFIG